MPIWRKAILILILSPSIVLLAIWKSFKVKQLYVLLDKLVSLKLSFFIHQRVPMVIVNVLQYPFSSPFFVFYYDIFKGTILGSQQNWWGQRLSISLLSPHLYSLSCYQHFPPEWCICYSWWSDIDTSSPEVHNLHYGSFTLDVVHSVGLDKCIMACIHHYGIIQSIFTALNPLCPTCSILPPATPWQLLFFLLSVSLVESVCSLFRLAPFT